MNLIDTHTHLFLDAFEDDREDMINRARDVNVGQMLLPNIDLSTVEPMLELCQKFPAHCFPMMGLHPCSVKEDYETQLQKMEEFWEEAPGEYLAVGETGLDYHWDTTYKDLQKLSLQKHIDWAKKYDKPLVLHTRKSFKDCLEMMKANNDDNLRGVFHCFSGIIEEAQKVIDLGGFYLGIGGVVTFKNSNLDETIKKTDLDHIVLETDSPYLTPEPHRGKRNESAYLRFVAEKIAGIKEITYEEVVESTSNNAKTLFFK